MNHDVFFYVKTNWFVSNEVRQLHVYKKNNVREHLACFLKFPLRSLTDRLGITLDKANGLNWADDSITVFRITC